MVSCESSGLNSMTVGEISSLTKGRAIKNKITTTAEIEPASQTLSQAEACLEDCGIGGDCAGGGTDAGGDCAGGGTDAGGDCAGGGTYAGGGCTDDGTDAGG